VRARRLQLLARDALARHQIVVPQLEQQLAALHAVAFAHRELLDASAERRRELGAPAGRYRSGARVGNRGLDPAGLGDGDHHRHRVAARGKPEPGGNCRNHEYGKGGAQRAGHGRGEPGRRLCRVAGSGA